LEAPRSWIVWNKRAVVSSVLGNPVVRLNCSNAHNRFVSPELAQLITAQQAANLRTFVRSGSPWRYSMYGTTPLGPNANCATGLAQMLNETGGASFGLCGPYGPRQVFRAPLLSNTSPLIRAAPPAAATPLATPLRRPYIEITAVQVR